MLIPFSELRSDLQTSWGERTRVCLSLTHAPTREHIHGQAGRQARTRRPLRRSQSRWHQPVPCFTSIGPSFLLHYRTQLWIRGVCVCAQARVYVYVSLACVKRLSAVSAVFISGPRWRGSGDQEVKGCGRWRRGGTISLCWPWKLILNTEEEQRGRNLTRCSQLAKKGFATLWFITPPIKVI